VSGSRKKPPQKTIDQKKRAVITRPFGREARIVMEKAGKNQALSASDPMFLECRPRFPQRKS
jgi:hypothetical protein